MAARFSSSAILRPVLATHIGLSATSFLCSTFGPSHLPTRSDNSHHKLQLQSSSPCHHHDMSNVCAALPWLDQLHDIVTGMYVCGDTKSRSACIHHNVMVQIGKDVSFENPIVSYSGVGEIERAFRGRLALHSQNDVKTNIECISVEASRDSISGGEAMDQHHPYRDGTVLIGNPSTSNIMPIISPPKVEITYRLSQQYGSFFSMHSLLVVTVQVRRSTSEKVRRITPHSQKLTMPLATSGFAPKATSTLAVALATAHANPALAKAASKIVAATRGQHSDSGCAPQLTSPLVAEVVRIEEQWNGVQLLRFTPFHCSRRLNGLIAGCATFLFFH